MASKKRRIEDFRVYAADERRNGKKFRRQDAKTSVIRKLTNFICRKFILLFYIVFISSSSPTKQRMPSATAAGCMHR